MQVPAALGQSRRAVGDGRRRRHVPCFMLRNLGPVICSGDRQSRVRVHSDIMASSTPRRFTLCSLTSASSLPPVFKRPTFLFSEPAQSLSLFPSSHFHSFKCLDHCPCVFLFALPLFQIRQSNRVRLSHFPQPAKYSKQQRPSLVDVPNTTTPSKRLTALYCGKPTSTTLTPIPLKTHGDL